MLAWVQVRQLFGQAVQVFEVRKNPSPQAVQAVAEVQVLQPVAQAWQVLTPEVTTSKNPAGQYPIQSFGSFVVPAPFKKRVKAEVAGGQVVQDLALEQVGQPVGLAEQSPHLPRLGPTSLMT